jgi:site-specific recombinase XerD
MSYIEQYHNALKSQGKSKNTIYAYMAPVRQFAAWLEGSVGDFAPEYWTEEYVRDYLAYLSRHKEPSSVRQAVKVLRLFFKWARDQGLIDTSIIEETRQEPFRPVDEGYYNWLVGRGVAENTRKAYLHALKIFMEWFEERTGQDFSPERITSMDINEFKLMMANNEKVYTAATVNNRLFALRNYCHYALETGLIKENPFHRLGRGVALELEPKKTRWLDNNEQYAFLRQVEMHIDKRGYKDYAIILTMLDAGLRTSEVCNLKLSDVKLYPVKEAKIDVRFSKWQRSREVPIASTKKGEGKRLHRALKVYLEERERFLASRGKKPDDVPWFFLSARGEKMTPKCIQRIMKRYRPEGTGKKITAHVLRHTFGHNLSVSNSKIELQDIAIFMGHMKKDGSPNLQTVSIYTLSSEKERRKKFNEAML